ncbi:MAG: (2Fe-2S)-binding protein, partial [Anaerolineae bacterium]
MSKEEFGSVELVVNGRQVRLADSETRTLLDVLRDDLGLWGVKNGCGTGHCGACTVLVDGKPRLACQTRLADVADCEVLTVEGLGSEEDLHPLQQAFIRYDAVQCGFCTPGMLLAAKALLDENPSPSEDDIRKALVRNICRCTGYHPIVEAVKAAASGDPAQYAVPWNLEGEVVGRSVIRKDIV